MAVDPLKAYISNGLDAQKFASAIDQFVTYAAFQRKPFERRWYDNNFFDDGFHFRYVSRTTNKIVDLSSKSDLSMPMRAIPKASLQIRGIANLLLQPDYTPVCYPVPLTQANFSTPEAFKQAYDAGRNTAKSQGVWLMEEWKKQEMYQKIVQMVLLASKNYVSYIQIWSDPTFETIKTQVYDAFDIYVKGDLTNIYDSPMIVKAVPKLISEIKENPHFSTQSLSMISPDNKMANSEVKEAYLRAKYQTGMASDQAATLIVKDAFVKEFLTDANWSEVKKTADKTGAMEGKSRGDVVIRQGIVAGGYPMYSTYTNLAQYPFVDFRFEPGQMYGTSLIERFIPANKSLDIVVSRLERYINTMVTGTWMVRKGEGLTISNLAGGQVLEYDQTLPTQGQIAPLPQFLFNYIGMLEKFISEQGASTSALGDLPSGIRSGNAIESLKATEYANLKIAGNNLKQTVKRIAERLLETADLNIITPQVVQAQNGDQVDSFSVMGQSAMNAREKLRVPAPVGTIPLSKDTKVDIQIEQGLGFTSEGRKAAMKDVTDYIQVLVQSNMMNPKAAMAITKRFLEVYEFGPTAEVMEAMEEGTEPEMNEEQMSQIKAAVLEVLKDAGMVGPEGEKKQVDMTKVAVLESLKESGLADKMQTNGQILDNPELAPIPYKDAPPSIQRQMEAAAGLQPATDPSPSEIESHTKIIQANKPVAKGGSSNGKE